MKIKTIELSDLEAGFLIGSVMLGMITFFVGLMVGHYLK